MVIHKGFFISLIMFTMAVFCSELFAQETGGIYMDPNRGEKLYRKKLIMNSNRIESILTNYGTFGERGNMTESGCWPKGTGHGHVDQMTLLIGAQVKDTSGKDVQIFTESYSMEGNSDGTQYMFNPLPGYANELRRFVKSDGKLDTTAQVAHSADKTTWPASWDEMAEAVGDAISNAVTLIDGLVVIGGGLAGAADIFLPGVVKEMNSMFIKPDGTKFRRLVANVYNLENNDETQQFLKGSAKEITVYGTDKKVKYDPEMRIGIGISKIGTSKAISIGAYAFALNSIDSVSR